MPYYLTVRRGQDRGVAWPIGPVPLIIGRDPGCTIRLDDPTVSRRHCQLILENDALKLRDMGSRNATLLNGAPVSEAVLAPGDEIGVGATVFCVIRATEPANGVTRSLPKPGKATSALSLGGPIYSPSDEASLFGQGKPRSTEDLLHLVNLGIAMSMARSMSGVASLLLQAVQERVAPMQAWLVWKPDPESRITIWPREGLAVFEKDTVLRELVSEALSAQKGVLLPESMEEDGKPSVRTTLVAPLILAGVAVGVLVARSETPGRMHDEDDLTTLLALAHTGAPYLRAMERLEQLETENRKLVAGVTNAGPILGSSTAMKTLREKARQYARTRLNVMILGETGTGKELLARMIHELSDLADRPMVAVNCAAIPDELFESEVFGHEKGAFTGAHAVRRGLLEEANGGTLFLDEVADLSLANQARLLRAIETGSFRRLGSQTEIRVSVRVVSATNADVRRAVEEGRFRRDLYHRLNAVELYIPPLRERIGDIPELAAYFLSNALARSGAAAHARFTPAALRALQRHTWPGNVRELRNVVERAVALAKGDVIDESDLALGTPPPERRADGFLSLQEMERRHIEEALRLCGGNVRDAAALLGIGRSTLYRKIEEYGLKVPVQ